MSANDARAAATPPAAATPQAVIFDIGSVILRLNIARALDVAGSGSGLSAKQVWRAVETDALWNDWQEGKIDPHDWHRHLVQTIGSPADFDLFSAAWCSVFEPEPIIGDDLFRALSARCRLALLSNTDPLHVAYMERTFSFVKYFPVRIYSSRVGARKPAAEIYRRALEELGVAASEALYIDDIAEFDDAARALGMIGFHFTGLAALEAELHRYGLPTT
jgi:putative hydrolase of the HAD superfamily